MFDKEKSIQRWLKNFRKYRAFHQGNIHEMELHIRDYMDDLVAQGVGEEEAFNQAVSEFGELNILAKEEFQNQKPKYKSQTVMISNYFKIALRNFWKHKSYATLNILGLTIGLTVVFLIGLFVNDELSFDEFHQKKDVLYRVVENQHYEGQPVFPVAVTPTALAPSLKAEYPEIVNSTRIANENFQFKIGEKETVETKGMMVDHSFFDMFSFEIISGSVDHFKEQLNALVLSEELAEKYFPDQNPLGQTIMLEDESFEVVAVMKDCPRNSHLEIRYFTNFENYLAGDSTRAGRWGSNWLYTYVELSPYADLKAVNDKVIGQIKANSEGSVSDIYLQPLKDIYLGEVDFVVEVSRKSEMIYVQIFSLVAIFILIISCVNFMNLSTARSEKRAKEVGLRKTIGATRKQLIAQFLSESILLSIISVVFSLILVVILLPYFNLITNKEFDWNTLLDMEGGIKLLVGILATAIMTGLLAGSYPAIFLSSLKPITSLNKHASANRGSFLRKSLVVLQFSISVFLIIGTLVVYKQFSYIRNLDLGYNKDHILYTYVSGNKSGTSFTNELRKLPGVESVGLSNRHPSYVHSSSAGFTWPGKNPEEKILLHFMGTDENYLPTMKMEILQGRNFLSTDSATVLINQRALEMMGLENPIGQTMNAYGDRKIVGVVADFNFKSVHTAIEPLVIFMIKDLSRVYIRYNPKHEESIASSVEEVWNEMFPNQSYRSFFLDTDFNEMYEAEERTGKLSTYFAIIAIIISCLGLFGLVSYAVEQRTKEIGIRKVMGASIPNLFFLLSTDFTKLVLISLTISIPVGWYVMNSWLDNYAYRTEVSILVFVLSGIAAILIALATVSYRSLSAAISNPVNALRDE